MKNEFLVIVLVIGAIGIISAIIGIIRSTINLVTENLEIGIISIVLDVALLLFCFWAIWEGVIKPLKRNERRN